MSERAWEPVLDGELAAEARAVVEDIAAALVERDPVREPGLKGDAATALLLGACGAPEAGPRLEAALVAALSTPMTISLFGGASGTSWVLHQLAAGPEVNAVIEHLDAALWRHLDVPRWEERHDLMSGLAGVGVLVAGREDGRARGIGERVLAHLESTAIASGAGLTWCTAPRFLPEVRRERFPDGMIDLGVAHGVPGVIGALAQFVEAGIEPARSRALLTRAVAWLLESTPPGNPRFGTSWPIDDPIKRIGWCYGDPGVAGVLLLASRALESDELASEAIGMLHRIAAPLEERGVPDASFCHGAAGLAHIYNAAYQRTGDRSLRDGAVRWLREVLRLREPSGGITGYTTLRIDGAARHREADATLITGVVGTALVLLAAVNEHEPAWQRLFAM